MLPDELKKNDVHIKRVKDLQLQIEGVVDTVENKEKLDFTKVREAIYAVAKDVRSTFNNREMSLVITKLQEAGHWSNEKNKKAIVARLTEAKNWAGEYIETLS